MRNSSRFKSLMYSVSLRSSLVLNLRRVGGVVSVEQVPEVEVAGTASHSPFRCQEPFTLLWPAAVQSVLLPEDVRTELAAGQATSGGRE